MSDHDHHSTHTHPYHLVNPSPWPVLGSLALLLLTFGMALFMHKKTGGTVVALAGLALVLYTMYGWWRDVIREGRIDKAHTPAVSRGLRGGMALFITSEVLFFAAFFWAFFDASMLPRLPIADDIWAIAPGVWPPAGIQTFDPFHLPFLNTLILLLSGCTVTWAHYEILHGNRKNTLKALWMTVILGVLFTLCQAFEYAHAGFGFKDGIYATTFYLATGFHGFHVIVGTMFLAVCLVRAYRDEFTPQQHLGFEFAAWYWHFVDAVWLFLFIFVYCDFANLPGVLTLLLLGAIGIGLATLAAGAYYGMRMLKGGMPKLHH